MIDEKLLLSERMIQREYEWTHLGQECPFTKDDFTEEDRSLSMDDFSRKQGWIK